MEKVKVEIVIGPATSEDELTAVLRVYEWIPDTGWQFKGEMDTLEDELTTSALEDELDTLFPDNVPPAP